MANCQYRCRETYPTYEQQPVTCLDLYPAVNELSRPETHQNEDDGRDAAYRTTCYDIWDKRIIWMCRHVGYFLGGRYFRHRDSGRCAASVPQVKPRRDGFVSVADQIRDMQLVRRLGVYSEWHDSICVGDEVRQSKFVEDSPQNPPQYPPQYPPQWSTEWPRRRGRAWKRIRSPPRS